MKFKDLINYLDEEFPKTLSLSDDRDGVDVCVDYNLEIGRVLIVLDVTLEAIDYAITNGYNCIISHHAVIYDPLKKLDLATNAAKKSVMLARHNICAAAFHTRLDAIDGGVNDCLIYAAGIAANIEKTELLLDPDENNIPIGRIVTLKEETDLKDFIGGIKKSLKKFYKKEFSCDKEFNINELSGSKKVKKIGIVGGGGMYFVKIAADAGADTFFTGEGKHHEILDAYEFFDMNIITAGHFETEAVVLPFVKQKILQKFPEAKVDCFVGENKNQ